MWWIYIWSDQFETLPSCSSSYDSTLCQTESHQVFSFLFYKSLKIVDFFGNVTISDRQTDRHTDTQTDGHFFFSSLTIISKTHVNILIHRHIVSETQTDRQAKCIIGYIFIYQFLEIYTCIKLIKNITY